MSGALLSLLHQRWKTVERRERFGLPQLNAGLPLFLFAQPRTNLLSVVRLAQLAAEVGPDTSNNQTAIS